MPFDVRCSGYERNIVQVDDLPLGSVDAVEFRRAKRVGHLELQVKFWLKDYQPMILHDLFR